MSPSPDQQKRGRVTGAVLSPWNLLLLLPVLMLVTPWYNRITPRLGGLPFFYWYQFLFVLVGVASVWIVYLTTWRTPTNPADTDLVDVDELDEGGRA